MNIDRFNEKYIDKGGVAKLAEMRAEMRPQGYIARHFGVSRERVKQWIKDMFGTDHDMRKARREKTIREMIEFARNHTKKEVWQQFKSNTPSYRREAIRRCVEAHIYDSE